MAPAAGAQHSHRPTIKSANKPFKSKHASKSALKERSKGKVEAIERGSRKTPHQQVMSKLDRRNHAKQLREKKVAERREEKSVFEGKNGAPRIVALIPLCEDVDSAALVSTMNASVDVTADAQTSSNRVEIARFKQRVQYLTPSRDLIECLDACRVADFVLFVLSAAEEVDDLGEQMLRTIESQGVSTVLAGVHNLDTVEPAKKRPDVVKSLKSFITHFFAAQEKVHDLSNRQDCSNLMRSLCTTMPKGISWREDRSWMLLEDVRWDGDVPILTGTVRGKGLKADRLVQVGDWGDFQVEKIVAAPLAAQRKAKDGEMAVDGGDSGDLLDEPTEDQDDLAELAPEEVTMDNVVAPSMAPTERKAVMLDDHHYFHPEDEMAAPKRLPRGTSKYQAAWYLGDVSDSGSDLESNDGDRDMNWANGSADGNTGGQNLDDDAMTEAAPSEYPQTENFADPAPEDEAEQLEAYRKQRHDEADDDLEFPDEIELHPNMNARERLARYRGLKDARTSAWDAEEDRIHEPVEWRRLLEISNYKAARNRIMKETLVGGVATGTRVSVHLRLTTPSQAATLRSAARPTALFSLLRHEHKRTVVDVSITLSTEHADAPLKSKTPLLLQCGPRRLVIRPLFSQGGHTPNGVHKFERFLHPGHSAVASFIGPVIWGSAPCLFFQATRRAGENSSNTNSAAVSSTPELHLLATGTALPTSPSRVIAKRAVLTGHPYKIHKKLVTVRYMFFSAEDVEYFSALKLWTRRGRSGFIKEPLGTHGYFKAVFDGKINPMDAVAVSLYKRVWPRDTEAWKPSEGVPEAVVKEVVAEEEDAGEEMVE